MFRCLIAGFILISTSVIASAGPFGIDQGTEKEQLNNLEATERPFRFMIAPPRPHPRFDQYHVKIHPRTGVCMLTALGVTINSSVYGTELQEEFKKIRGQLAEVYGPSTLADFLNLGSIWNEPRDWMIALQKNERTLQAAWDKGSNANLKDGIVEILLTAQAFDDEQGWLALQYRFANEAQCQNLIDKEAAKSF